MATQSTTEPGTHWPQGAHQAFQAVKESIGKVLTKDNACLVVKRGHHDWYAELFGPTVTAGIVEADQLTGYRLSVITKFDGLMVTICDGRSGPDIHG